MENLWDKIKNEYNTINVSDNFRSIDGFNKRLATWNPITNDSRYYKSLLFEFCNHLDSKIKDNLHDDKDSKVFSDKGDGFKYLYNQVKNTSKGNPTSIKYYGIDVNIDYALSVEETLFLRDVLQKSRVILEIGSGFGRLVHSIIQSFDNIEKFYVVDLEWMLQISFKYLKEVLTDNEFSKIEFIQIKDYNLLTDIDLAININSFQEMEEKTIKDYLMFISKNSKYFYSKNTVCKYNPISIDLDIENKEQFNVAKEMGLSRSMIDIFDVEVLEKEKSIHELLYCPSNFRIEKHQDCFGQFLHYYSVLYKKAKI